MSSNEVDHGKELITLLNNELNYLRELKESYLEEAAIIKEIEEDEELAEKALELPVTEAKTIFAKILQKYFPQAKIEQ